VENEKRLSVRRAPPPRGLAGWLAGCFKSFLSFFLCLDGPIDRSRSRRPVVLFLSFFGFCAMTTFGSVIGIMGLDSAAEVALRLPGSARGWAELGAGVWWLVAGVSVSRAPAA
jgi:hypothetical protein